jgi:hypothetical protein
MTVPHPALSEGEGATSHRLKYYLNSIINFFRKLFSGYNASSTT